MQTHFTPEQLADPKLQEADHILRKCVHCGFCTATCPTYVELGNELDSPRGRIYLITDMLENDKPASAKVALHVDRCLSCLACVTTCPSGVDYMHLIDQARVRVERTYRRPIGDRLMRWTLAKVLPYRGRFRLALRLSFAMRPLAALLGQRSQMGRRLAAMRALAPLRLPRRTRQVPGRVFSPDGKPQARVALLTGCAQAVLDPAINAATIRLLNRFGVEVVLAPDEGCCGALVHHLGREREALAFARQNVKAWIRTLRKTPLDAIIVTASGCGTTIKDYGHMLRLDSVYAKPAARIAALAMDLTEFLSSRDLLPPEQSKDIVVAYHSACSMQHGQGIVLEPKLLLRRAGFTVVDIPEGHLCCGSAGTYNILQPEIAARLAARKAANIESVAPDLIATGNIGCITQIAASTEIPILHTAELLDWAYGGEWPEGIEEVEDHPERAAAAE